MTLSRISEEIQRQSWQPHPLTPAYTPVSQISDRMYPMPGPELGDDSLSTALPPGFFNSYYMPPPTKESHRNYWPTSYSEERPPASTERQERPIPATLPSTQSSRGVFPTSNPPSSNCSYSGLSPSSAYSSDQGPSPTAWPSITECSIEPDPLPPHSNPQALTQTQSQAFTESKPVPPVRVGKDDVYSTISGLASFTILREAAHMPLLLSTMRLLTVTRTSTGTSVGQIRFHNFSTNSIEMMVRDRHTTMSLRHGMLHSRRWGFQCTSIPNKVDTWYWKKDKSTGGAVLEQGKHRHARILARIKGDLLTFAKESLTDETYDEIIVSAVAMAEAARRVGKDKDVLDLASTSGDFTAAAGGRVGED